MGLSLVIRRRASPSLSFQLALTSSFNHFQASEAHLKFNNFFPSLKTGRGIMSLNYAHTQDPDFLVASADKAGNSACRSENAYSSHGSPKDAGQIASREDGSLENRKILSNEVEDP